MVCKSKRLILNLALIFIGWCVCEVSRAGPQQETAAEVAVIEEIPGPLRQWHHWRGPLQTGEAPNADPPTSWSEQQNIRWKTSLDGLGHSTPVIAGNSIFLTWAQPTGEPFEPRPDTAPGAHDNKLVSSKFNFVAASVDRKSGEFNWKRNLHSAIPHEGAHVSASLASASPCTDGKRVWFQFGSYGLYCLDFSGKTIWTKTFGKMHSKHGHGEGATPVVADDYIAVNWDHENESFVVALNKETGEEIWRQARDEVTSWSSPIVVDHGGRKQLIVAGTNRNRAYDLKTGELIWQCGGMSQNIVATPVHADGAVYFGCSYEKRQMIAVKLEGAAGDITTSDNVLWTRVSKTPYVPSMLLVDRHLYFLRHYQGILTRLVAATGEEPSGPFRLGSMNEIYASPVSAAGRIYVTDRSGTTAVISADSQPDRIAVNRLNDRFSASMAIVGDDIVLRGERFLYYISEEGRK